ncbi:response regulator transcription factor [filamentous cyanobacterium LEGE 11480]|uniref:Response regulator transcription factor n=1 Tax=Romeriopsis navalis LEGE 11480 TaxID=2777977 RepID=A0A928VQ52_9CYAN|nr:response regulator transcription factor [Romeriopsis navalis]MBE9030487.1 response regulator transcription factor [Romeriopsis navalis LEGE 11480]
MTTNNIRILLVDDQYLIREGIASLLELEDGIEVVGLADNGQSAIAQALKLKPSIVLMDVRMPEMNGVAATAKIRKALPTCQVLMLTTFDDEEFIVQSLLAGACGYLMKDIPSKDLAQAIKLAHAGVFQLAPEVAGKLVGQLRQPPGSQTKPPADPALTTRELEILNHLAKGATNKEIAQDMHVSEGTVKNHVSHILTKLDLRDRTQAAVYAVEHHLE